MRQVNLEEQKTKYTVNPLPHKELSAEIIQAFKDRPCKLDAIFDNDDPFAEWSKYTKLFFEETKPTALAGVEEKPVETITLKQAGELQDILSNCDPEYLKTVNKTLEKAPFNVTELAKLPAIHYQRLKKAALEKMAEYQMTIKNDPVDWIMEA